VKLYSDSSTVKMKEPGDRSSASPALDQTVSNAPEDEDKNVRDVPLKENLKEIETLVKNNDYTAAFDIITEEIRQQPDHPDLNAWFGMVLLKMDKPSEARGYLEKATRLSPNIPEFHNGLGYSYFFLKRYDEAIDAFNNALRLDSGHLDALTGLCITYAKNDDKEKAMDIYLKIKNIDKKTSNQLLAIINQ